MPRFLRVFRILWPWRGREVWHWVLLDFHTRVIAVGPFIMYKEALEMALHHPDQHPRIVVELSWRHPWIQPSKEEVADKGVPVIAGTKLDSVHIDDCFMPSED